ncbi:MAG: hypothetical protein JEZ06_08030 [Anaerolineaceae bacterium]|nr:hypothetical protein [Anaerolineaceae bacterium]
MEASKPNKFQSHRVGKWYFYSEMPEGLTVESQCMLFVPDGNKGKP